MLFRATVLTVLLSVLQAGCATHEPPTHKSALATLPATDQKGRPALAENLDATAFKAALIGEWESVWADPHGSYVKRLIIGPNGKASVTFVREKTEETIEGTYSVVFLRPPSPTMVTLAAVDIMPSTGEPVVLSQVNFGFHNAVRQSRGLLLRIDKSQFGRGVFTRAPDR